MKEAYKVHIALFIVSLIYGANYNIGKAIMPDYVQAFGIIVLRVTGASILFWILHAAAVKEKVDFKADFWKLLICAITGVAANQLLFFKGLSLTSPINASVIMTTSPILVLIASAIILKEKITRKKMLGIFLGLVGAFFLIGGTNFSFSGETVTGDFLILLNGSSYGIYLVLVKPLMKKYSPFTIIKWIFTMGWFMVLPFGVPELLEVNWETIPVSIWASLAYVVIATTFIVYWLNAWALKRVSPSIVGFYIYFQPLIATSIAILFGTHALTLEKVLFSLLIFLGVFLVSKK